MNRPRGLLRDGALVLAAAVVTTVLAQTGIASAFNVPNNSVNSAKIVNGSIQGIDVKDGAIASADVANGSLTGADVQDGTIGTQDVADGSLTDDDVAVGTLTGANIAQESVTRQDVDPLMLPRWAKVNGGLSTSYVFGVGGESASRLGVGIYRVEFVDSIVGCGWSATITDEDAGAAGGTGARFATVKRDSSAVDDALRVRTFDSNGPADTEEDDGFTVVVLCG